VLEYSSHGEIDAGSLLVELIGSDPADETGEQRAELVKLVERFHWPSLGQAGSIVYRAAVGNGQLGSFPVTA
jgi:hypothetical protein